jgi:CRP-like cAMP-binding protein
MEKPPSIELPDTKELILSISWLKGLSKESQKLVNDACQTKIYSTGQRIVKNIKPGDGLYIIARGSVNVKDGDHTLEVLGKGDAIGEITYFTKEESAFTVVAESPATILWVSLNNIDKMIATDPELKSMLMKHASGRLAVRLLSTHEKYRHMDDRQLRSVGEKGTMIEVKKGKLYSVPEGKTSALISGKVVSSQNDKLVISTPKALTFKEVKALQDAWVIEI